MEGKKHAVFALLLLSFGVVLHGGSATAVPIEDLYVITSSCKGIITNY